MCFKWWSTICFCWRRRRGGKSKHKQERVDEEDVNVVEKSIVPMEVVPKIELPQGSEERHNREKKCGEIKNTWVYLIRRIQSDPGLLSSTSNNRYPIIRYHVEGRMREKEIEMAYYVRKRMEQWVKFEEPPKTSSSEIPKITVPPSFQRQRNKKTVVSEVSVTVGMENETIPGKNIEGISTFPNTKETLVDDITSSDISGDGPLEKTDFDTEKKTINNEFSFEKEEVDAGEKEFDIITENCDMAEQSRLSSLIDDNAMDSFVDTLFKETLNRGIDSHGEASQMTTMSELSRFPESTNLCRNALGDAILLRAMEENFVLDNSPALVGDDMADESPTSSLIYDNATDSVADMPLKAAMDRGFDAKGEALEESPISEVSSLQVSPNASKNTSDDKSLLVVIKEILVLDNSPAIVGDMAEQSLHSSSNDDNAMDSVANTSFKYNLNLGIEAEGEASQRTPISESCKIPDSYNSSGSASDNAIILGVVEETLVLDDSGAPDEKSNLTVVSSLQTKEAENSPTGLVHRGIEAEEEALDKAPISVSSRFLVSTHASRDTSDDTIPFGVIEETLVLDGSLAPDEESHLTEVPSSEAEVAEASPTVLGNAEGECNLTENSTMVSQLYDNIAEGRKDVDPHDTEDIIVVGNLLYDMIERVVNDEDTSVK